MATEDRLAALWVTYLRSGTHRGELLALTWTEDVDLEAGLAWIDEDRLSCQEDGTGLDPDRISAQFTELCDEAEVRRVRLHDTRHGMATGVPIEVVRKRLGHARISVTYDMYTHPDDAQQREAADAFSRLIAGEAETS